MRTPAPMPAMNEAMAELGAGVRVLALVRGMVPKSFM